MARGPVCTYCEEKLVTGRSFCSGCGHPTQWADHDERVLWELGQWEGAQKSGSAGSSKSGSTQLAARKEALAESVRTRAATVATQQPAQRNGDSRHRRSVASRFRPVAPPDAAPAAPVNRAPSNGRAPAASTRTTAPVRPSSPPAAPPGRSNGTQSQTNGVKPAPRKVFTAGARSAQPFVRQAPPAPAAPPPRLEAPLVIMRKPVTEQRNGNDAATEAAASAPVAAPPAKKARAPKAPKVKPAREPKAKPAPKHVKSNDGRKKAEKRERKHRRHSKRVNRRAASLDLKAGERVSLSIEGWSRLRRATLVVTNYRVALITRVPPQVRWIPLEEVSLVTRRWQGAWSVMVAAPTEVLTLQKAKRQMLASFKELLESEVKEARTAGSERHDADITQEWCDRATTIWDSRPQRIRLWLRRHPVVTLGLFLTCTVGAFFLMSVLTSLFSPIR